MAIKLNWNIQKINDYMKEKKLTKTKFAKECGISYYMLKKIYDNYTKMNVLVLAKIARKMKCSFK